MSKPVASADTTPATPTPAHVEWLRQIQAAVDGLRGATPVPEMPVIGPDAAQAIGNLFGSLGFDESSPHAPYQLVTESIASQSAQAARFVLSRVYAGLYNGLAAALSAGGSSSQYVLAEPGTFVIVPSTLGGPCNDPLLRAPVAVIAHKDLPANSPLRALIAPDACWIPQGLLSDPLVVLGATYEQRDPISLGLLGYSPLRFYSVGAVVAMTREFFVPQARATRDAAAAEEYRRKRMAELGTTEGRLRALEERVSGISGAQYGIPNS
jgi:hypothetical protein